MKPYSWDADAIATTEGSINDWIKSNHHEPDEDGEYVKVNRLPSSSIDSDGISDEADAEQAQEGDNLDNDDDINANT